jgi:GDPmannose 4,6-dehydratase
MGAASPYAAAKLYAHHLAGLYREARGMFVSAGILFNHESPRRGEAFVTRKIARAVGRIARGEQRELRLGPLEPRRDWGFAGDYVRAMWMMLQADAPMDLVIGTGVAHSVQEFCEAAFTLAGLDWRAHVVVDESLRRPGDVPLRLSDPTKARQHLGWTPEVDFNGLVEMMVHAELTSQRPGDDHQHERG